MPNWCFNNLKIEASPDAIQSLMEKAKGFQSPQQTDELMPFSMLPFVAHYIPENYEKDWFNVNYDLLGCKWFPEITSDEIHQDDDSVSLSFDTPWEPSINATRHIATWLTSEGFVFTIRHFYEEPGMGFGGLFTIYSDGESHEFGDLVEIYEDELKSLATEFQTTVEQIRKDAASNGLVRLCPDFYKDMC